MEQPLACHRCGTEVLVEKYSWQHTNIQWTAPSATVCPEVRDQVEAGVAPSRVMACSSLRDAVHEAAVAGTIDVDA